MPRFAFEARDSSGHSQSGQRDATDAPALAEELAAGGLVPIRVVPAEDAPAAKSTQGFSLFEKKVSIDEVILFSHQMYSLTRAGISIVRAVRGLAESQTNERLQEVLLDIAANLEAGVDLASSFRQFPRVFSELYASIIHVGENTGRLDEAFKQIAVYMEIERETKKRIKTATRYPSFVLAAIGIAIVVLNVFVIPSFPKFLPNFTLSCHGRRR